MSSERFNQLAARHASLRLRSAVQRRELGATMSEIEHQLGGVDRGIATATRVLKNPMVIVGGVAIFAMIGPKRLMRWLTKGALAYSTAKRFVRLRRMAQ